MDINEIQDKFSDVPLDEETAVLLEQKAMLDQYEVLYPTWSWGGINAESIIFLSEDVSELSNEELKALAKYSPLIKKESELTVNDRSNKYTFVNFNFEDSSDDCLSEDFWKDDRSDEERKRDRDRTNRYIAQRNKEEITKCKK